MLLQLSQVLNETSLPLRRQLEQTSNPQHIEPKWPSRFASCSCPRSRHINREGAAAAGDPLDTFISGTQLAGTCVLLLYLYVRVNTRIISQNVIS